MDILHAPAVPLVTAKLDRGTVKIGFYQLVVLMLNANQRDASANQLLEQVPDS